jgi:formylmethanofuran dehydrogenase subunit B
VIGPRATLSPLGPRQMAIDTGLAGVHDAGTALRLDDVPLPVRSLVVGPPATASVVARLRGALAR